MVNKRAAALDRVFRALASEPRREILRRVAEERLTVGELAGHFDITLAAISKHVRVLEDADLIVQTREGRLHWCQLNPRALDPALASIENLRAFWANQLDGLEQFLERENSEPRARPAKQKARRR